MIPVTIQSTPHFLLIITSVRTILSNAWAAVLFFNTQIVIKLREIFPFRFDNLAVYLSAQKIVKS